MSKPFEPRELILRIRNILDRRTLPTPQLSSVIFGAFIYDLKTNILSENGRRVHITSAEQELMRCFVENTNKTLSRDDISTMLGGRMKEGLLTLLLRVCVQKLRLTQDFQYCYKR